MTAVRRAARYAVTCVEHGAHGAFLVLVLAVVPVEWAAAAFGGQGPAIAAPFGALATWAVLRVVRARKARPAARHATAPHRVSRVQEEVGCR